MKREGREVKGGKEVEGRGGGLNPILETPEALPDNFEVDQHVMLIEKVLRFKTFRGSALSIVDMQ